MSSINFRLYGDQIYGLGSKYLNEYINPEINKEDFLTNFNNGLLELNITGIKKPINILPYISIKDLKSEKIEINIPDDKTNFILKLNKLRMMLTINSLDDNQILDIVINKRKKLIEKFIKETIKTIEKKEESSFLKGLIDSLLKRALDGLEIELKEVEIYLRCNNIMFLLKINSIIYNQKDGIKINDINLLYNETNSNNNKTEVIKHFYVGIEINKSMDNSSSNSLKVNCSDLNIEINRNFYLGVMKIIKIFKEINYKQIYLRYKKLIELNKPKKDPNNDKKIYYQSLWYWCIKTLIKLSKYKSSENKSYIFDLINSTQDKFAKKYISHLDKENEDNNSLDDCLILPEEITLLKATKEKVESQLLENKKGNQLANAFKFFFGGGDDENKKELTEEEKENLNNLYTQENIIYFINKKKQNVNSNNNNENGDGDGDGGENKKEEQIIDKFKNFFKNFSIFCIFGKIEILLNYFYSKHSLYVKDINTKIDINKLNETKNFKMNIGDIGYDSNISIFKNKINDKDNEMISFIKNNDVYEINFGFNNIEINEKIILFIINFYYSIKFKFEDVEYKFFIKQKYRKNDIKKKLSHTPILDRIKFNKIPSVTFSNSINNFSIICEMNLKIEETLIAFSIKIKDNKSNNILDNYEMNVKKNKENSYFDLNLTNKLNISLSPETTYFISIFFFEIKKLKQYYIADEVLNRKNTSKENEANRILYGFHYNIYKKLKINEEFLNNLNINLSISNFCLEIKEKKGATTLNMSNFSISYKKNKNLLIKSGILNLMTTKSSPLFLFNLRIKAPDFGEYEKILIKKIKKDFDVDINEDLLTNNNIRVQNLNRYEYSYHNKIGLVINSLINSLKIFITELRLNYKNEKNVFSLYFFKTFGEKKENLIKFNTETTGINYINDNDPKTKINLMEMKEKNYIDLNYVDKEIFIKNSNNIKISINPDQIKLLKESFDLEIDKKRLKGYLKKLKIKAEISNPFISFNNFNINISKIFLKNYEGFISNALDITISSLNMKSNDNNILNVEKEITLKYKYNPKTHKKLFINSNEIKIMISQDDIYHLILSIFNVYINSSNDKKEKRTIINDPEKIKNLDIELKIPTVNLSLCSNNYLGKIGELSISNSLFQYNKRYNRNNNNSNEFIFVKETKYTVLINKIFLSFVDVNNNKLSLIKSGSDKNNQNMNHIELFCNNDKDITININKNYIILRGDSFYSFYYYFKKAIPLAEIKNSLSKKNKDKMEKRSKLSTLKFNFGLTKFLIPSSFNANENMCLNVDNFIINFNSVNNSKFPIGHFGITLSSIHTIINSDKNIRKLFDTNNNFLSINLNYDGKNLSLEVGLDSLIINLSYTDITTFLKTFYLNKILIDHEKKIRNNNNNSKIINDNNPNPNSQNYFRRLISEEILKKTIAFSGRFFFKNFNITLIDNSSGSYYPFAKLGISRIDLNMNPDKSVKSYFSLFLSSYNYISCVWEPSIENIFVQLNYQENKMDMKKYFNINIDKMNVNISDMSLSFTLNSLNSWVKKLIEENKNYKNNEYGILGNNLIDIKTSIYSSQNLTKISNNKLINKAGVDLIINYANQTYNCGPGQNLELEYINENEWNKKGFDSKQITLSVKGFNNTFSIPLERICTREHNISNPYFIISENVLNKERQIDINVYSPIIFKNKSIYKLQVNIFNKSIGNKNYFLDKNSLIGLPLNYYHPQTFFNFSLQNNNNSNHTSENYSLNEIVNFNLEQSYLKNITIDSTVLLMSLSTKIPKVKTLTINCEYIIINCLPCNIGISYNGGNYIVEKLCQHYLNFYNGNDSEISIQLSASNTTFFSRPKKLFQIKPKENGNFLKFKNSSNLETFRLLLLIKNDENKKVIVIYAESILDNKSGVDFYIKSKNMKNMKNICFQIAKNLFIISSKINMKLSSFCLINDAYNYCSKSIFLSEVMHASPNYYLDLRSSNNYKNKYPPSYNISENQIRLIIDNSISYVTPKDYENNKYHIMTMIYRIYSTYRITNLLSTKNFIIASQDNPGEYLCIEPMSQINFDFFHRGKNIPLMFSISNLENSNYTNGNNFQFTSSFYLKENGTYTFKIRENMFNLEIRKSSIRGIIDVFVVETNIDNGKVIIDNMTNNILNICQANYQSFNQIVRGNEKQILHVYDQNIMKFFFKMGEDLYGDFDILTEIDQKRIELNNDIIMCLESNGIKMKVSFYYRKILEKYEEKINNYNFKIGINEILLSMIGDNEFKNKNLRNYERNEILLLDMINVSFDVNWQRNIGLLGKDIVNTNFTLGNLSIYNQMKNDDDKYVIVLNNTRSPCISLRNIIYHFKNDNIWKIGSFALHLSDLILKIDPVFIEEIMDFVKNIIYRMKIKNYKIDKIFLINENENLNESFNLNNYQNKIKEYIENYKKKGIVFHGNNFQLPQIELHFRVSRKGLEHLLINKFGCSQLFIWAAKGLTNQKNSINLEPYTIPSYIGDFTGIFKLILLRYKNSIFSELSQIAIKGFIGNITKMIDNKVKKKVLNFINFLNDEPTSNRNNHHDDYVKEERKRMRRPFYGKLQYFKEFNKDDAYYFDLIQKGLNDYNMKIFFTNLVKGSENNLYVFTTSSLLMMSTNVEIYNTIYYYYIDINNILRNNNEIFIKYNQNIDGRTYCQFKVENPQVAEKVCTILKEEAVRNKDNFNDI